MSNNMQFSIQEAAAQYANNTLSAMNQALVNMYGIDVLWFRSIPQKRSEDVIFQAYTLHNVESCPLELKVIYNDTSYDDAALTFTLSGIDYKPTLTLEMPVATWYDATKRDGTMPQKRDIVYVPQTKKLWQVATMTPVAALGGQVTSFKMMMETYTPEADRLVGGELADAIEENTVSIDKIFGEAIDNTLVNLTDKNQLSNKTSTEKDEYKKLTKSQSKKSILNRNHVDYIHSENLIVDGHIFARSYYDMENPNDIVVEYRDINDVVTIDDTRCLSIWANVKKNANTEYSVSDIRENGSDKTHAYIMFKSPIINKLKEGDTLKLFRNSIYLYGEVYSKEDGEICLKVPTGVLKAVKATAYNWNELKNYKVKVETPINLLSGESTNGYFGIDLIAGHYILLTLNGRTYTSELMEDIKEDTWYGFIINVSTTLTVDVFTEEEHLEKISTGTVRTRWDDDTFNRYYIKSSPSLITNIRYYCIENTDIDKQLTDLVSYNIKNNSLAIINDSADIYLENSYYGEQR